MPTARGLLDVNIEAEPPFLEQDGLKLNRSVERMPAAPLLDTPCAPYYY